MQGKRRTCDRHFDHGVGIVARAVDDDNGPMRGRIERLLCRMP